MFTFTLAWVLCQVYPESSTLIVETAFQRLAQLQVLCLTKNNRFATDTPKTFNLLIFHMHVMYYAQ